MSIDKAFNLVLLFYSENLKTSKYRYKLQIMVREGRVHKFNIKFDSIDSNPTQFKVQLPT